MASPKQYRADKLGEPPFLLENSNTRSITVGISDKLFMRRSSWVTPRGARRISRNKAVIARVLAELLVNQATDSGRRREWSRRARRRSSGCLLPAARNSSSSAEGWAREQLFVDRLERAVAHLELRPSGVGRRVIAEDRFAEQLQQQLLEAAARPSRVR